MRQQTPNAWEERTQTTINTANSTLLDTPIPMNIQQILNEVKASNDRVMRNSAEAMASVQGVATVLSTVTDQIDTLEATLTQTNRNTQKIALKLEQHSQLFSVILQ